MLREPPVTSTVSPLKSLLEFVGHGICIRSRSNTSEKHRVRNSTPNLGSLVFCALTAACVDEPLRENEPGANGRLSASVSAGSAHDVSSVRYRIVLATQSCSDAPLAERVVPVPSDGRSRTADPADAGDAHPFAGALFVLRAGEYRVCAQPLKADAAPSAKCASAQTTVTVFPRVTTEVTLISQCKGDSSGGLGITTVLNDPPRIDDLNIEPEVLTSCDEAKLTVTASDPNFDTISYAWELTRGNAILLPSNNTALFRPSAGGDYEVRVSVKDSHDATSSLTVPLHVSGGSCAADAGADVEAGESDSSAGGDADADAADAGPQGPDASFRSLGSFGPMSPGVGRISANGSTVVGHMWPPQIDARPHVFRWSEETGVLDMGAGGIAVAVNGDGSVIAAGVNVGNEPNHAHRWTAVSGWVSLEDPGAPLRSSDATGINPAGTVIVGEARDYGAFRWTAASGMVPLGPVPRVTTDGRWNAHDTSDDGSVIVGVTYSKQAIRWTESTGPVMFLGTEFVESNATGVSGDGRVVVGYINDADNWQGFRWTVDEGLQRLGDPFSYTFAGATNADGSVVVGSSSVRAFVWDPAHGMRLVHSVLEQAGIELSGWSLFGAADVSADGTIIVGSGVNPGGGDEAWIARLP
jgi:hypothetical protein